MAVLYLLLFLFAAIAKSAEVEGYFEPNLGQAPANVQFLGRGLGGVTLFDSRAATLMLARGEQRGAVGIQIAQNLHFEPDSEPLRGVSAYFRGPDPEKWLRKVPHYSRIRAREAIPGVDLVFYWTGEGQLEYDFIVRPGVDPSGIKMRFSSRLSLDLDGSLIVHTALGDLRQRPPKVYQTRKPDSAHSFGDETREIAASYKLDGQTARFEVAPYDRAMELVIDPVIQFSTFLGGSDADSVGGIASGANGSVYITGTAGSVNSPENAFPAVNSWTPGGGFHRGGGTDAFVMRLDWDPSLNRPVLIYSTFLGGGAADSGLSIAVSAAGSAHITGRTFSRDFPLVRPIAVTNKTTIDGDVFVARLTQLASGELNLVFSTRIGGSADDQGNAIAIDSAGAIHVGGIAGYIGDFPTVNGLASGSSGSGGFVLKLTPTTDSYRIAYSTILGSEVRGIALSFDGACHVTGVARAGLPVVNGLPSNSIRGPTDAFAARLQYTTVLRLAFATYLGGTGDDAGNAIAFVEPGDIYIAGQASAGFPVLNAIPGNEAVQGTEAAFLTHLSWNGIANSLVMGTSTLLTSGGADRANALAAGFTGVFLTGTSRRGPVGSRPFPGVDPVQLATGNPGDTDAFVSYFRFPNSSGAPTLTFSSILGGNFSDLGGAIAVDPGGGVFVAGTSSPGFPSMNSTIPHGATVRGLSDVFLLRLVETPNVGTRRLTIRNSGGGTISGPGITCAASACTITASGSVVLSATPQSDHRFAGWSGACSGFGSCSVILDSDKTVNAQFGYLENLNVFLAGNGRGIVFGAGVDCGTNCLLSLPADAPVTLRALPSYTSEFLGWSGSGCSGSSLECTFIMRPGTTVTATFTQKTLTASGLEFVPVSPCRIVDTRAFALGAIPALGSRSIPVRGGSCGVPPEALAYSINTTVVPVSGSLGYLTLWPTGSLRPIVSTLNSLDGRVKANAAIVPAGNAGEVSVFVTDTSHVILDINGYFRYGGISTANAFNPVTPCRVVDTRTAVGPLGGPSIAAEQTREFPVLASGCGVPAGAKAYSLNVTAVPKQKLGYLTIWPGGNTARPVVSTLNATTGTIVANAALVPASASGTVNVFATDETDLIMDINGYFGGPPTGPSGGLLFYPVVPCRIADTRLASLGGPSIAPLETREINPAGKCALPSQAKAYAANATILPRATLGFLTLWPADAAQPLVSTLNALDGAITANGAILPAAAVGSISMFSTDWIDLILDVSGFFAP